jgi:bis(5'-nucleosyl)-tetraphosphatase (symmetrical)
MAVYAIGDVQGCYDSLARMLDHLQPDESRDELIFCGDLVNRGGQSLQVLRCVKSLGAMARVVLGNHDLHLLAESIKPLDRRQKNLEFSLVLEAEDAAELLEWLRFREVLIHHATTNFVIVHAGLAPTWTLQRAKQEAEFLERHLRLPDYANLLVRMYGNRPNRWNRDLKGMARCRAAINIFTRMRFCNSKGEIAFDMKGPPGTQKSSYYPWYEVPGMKPREFRVAFGHWSTLDRFQGLGVYGLDTGCVWGRRLTALRLDSVDPEFISVASTLPAKVVDSADLVRD